MRNRVDKGISILYNLHKCDDFVFRHIIIIIDETCAEIINRDYAKCLVLK